MISALGDDNDSLICLMAKLREFDEAFCQHMVAGSKFTIRLEISGNHHKMNQARIILDHSAQP